MGEKEKILITGGAGFIGSHLCDELLSNGYDVRVLDSLSPQVHEDSRSRPEYLSREVELLIGHVEDRDLLRRALCGVRGVFHFAAKVGVGQSMYQAADYTAVNNLGTAIFMEELVEHQIEKLVVASSMSIYGEGMYRDASGELVSGGDRPIQQLKKHLWEHYDEKGIPLVPVPTTELKVPSLASIYALSKFDQERMCLLLGAAYGILTLGLRFFNVYGARQSLSNPYTGVLAIFASELLQGRVPQLYEDGLQMRDFVNVRDVARACRLALESDVAGEAINIGSGHQQTIREVAAKLAKVLGKPSLEAQITDRYRVGDVRHCFADITKAGNLLGYQAEIGFDDGLDVLARWLEGRIVVDRGLRAGDELMERGLTV
jgi:dTDP-L-rhamnose 4-epimerase